MADPPWAGHPYDTRARSSAQLFSQGPFYRDMATKRGTRIDYILATPDLAKQVESAVVLTDTEASDLQPVATTFTG